MRVYVSSSTLAMPELAFETGHADMIHDAQFDYYGKRLATASSDMTIKVFDVSGEAERHECDIVGHEGPVWKVSWAHPKFTSILASCSYDQRVIIWKENPNSGTWDRIHEKYFSSSVNSISWAPHEFGLVLLAGSSDGKIAMIRFSDNVWQEEEFHAHPGGVNAVSWGPSVAAGKPGEQVQMRFVSGGCDSCVRLWKHDNGSWTEDASLTNDPAHSHSEWVRDVAWCPSLGLKGNTIASCADDKSVLVWMERPGGAWEVVERLQFDKAVWRVSWSTMGNLLAVSHGEDQVSLWREGIDGKYTSVSSPEDAAQ